MGLRIPAIEMSQTQIEDFRFDVFGTGGMDRLAQLLNEQFDELLRGRAEGSFGTLRG